ncbi:MAG: hypothetical protein AMJ55_10830 [Gammaproteobacteria bacterium SG8_15]|nr:MAG: hypothetical protein AMJ55_10830 [Gammaproteobacteria bacterium SG8_15]
MNQPVFINLELKVIKAEVDKNKDEVEFVAQFNMDSLPDPSDKISAKFGDIDLGSVSFGEFVLVQPNIYKYRDGQLEVRLNFRWIYR